MIYLTNDALDQAVYFELRGREAQKTGTGAAQVFFGLLGNGVHEVAVTLKKSRCGIDVTFGRSELFCFVEEDDVRRMLGRMLRNRTMH